jgi:ABC-type glutathione transport system ATPase component
MAKIISVIGNKGGTGKTTLSHMLGEGLGLFGHRAVVVLTDTTRTQLSRTNRRYLPADARTPHLLDRVVQKLHSLDGWIGIVDGGGGRTEKDRRLHSVATLVLLPFRDSPEDIRTVVQDLERFPSALAVPSQWPTNPWQREAADRLVDAMLGDQQHRLIEPVPAVSSSKLLLLDEIPDALPTPLNNACRRIAGQVLDRLGLAIGVAEDDAA